jgi:hypothetical protein
VNPLDEQPILQRRSASAGRTRQHPVRALAMGSLIVASLFLGAQAEAGQKAAPSDPFSEQALTTYVSDVLPALEEAAERSFKTQPTVVWVEPKTLSVLMAEELRQIYSAAFPGLQPQLVEHMAQSAALSLGGLLGKYTPKNHTVHISTNPFKSGLESGEYSEQLATDMVRLVVAHELAHALQQEKTDLLGVLMTAQDADAVEANRATIEGQATWLEVKVAEALDLHEAHKTLTAFQGWGKDGLEKLESFPVWATYGQGMLFIDALTKEHGQAYVWETLLAKPPQRTAMLYRPETYGQPAPTAEGFATALDGPIHKLTKNSPWSVINSTLGETTLRGEALYTDMDELETILGHIVKAQQLLGMLPDREADIRVIEFDDAAWAKRYVTLLSAQKEDETKRIQELIEQPINVSFEPFEDVSGDIAIRREQQVPIGGGRYAPSDTVWVVRGNICVVVMTTKFRPGLRIGWTVQDIFERLKSVP